MKVHGTKKETAGNLWRRLAKGPHLDIPITFAIDHQLNLSDKQTRAIEQEMERQVCNWIASWIVGDIKKLVPKIFHPAFEWGKEPRDGSTPHKG